jgi:hypothetical protein
MGNIPIDIGLYNAGFLYHFQNNVQPWSPLTCTAVSPQSPQAATVNQMVAHGLKVPKDVHGNYLIPNTCAVSFDVAAIGWDVLVQAYSQDPKANLSFDSNIERALAVGGIVAGALLAYAGICLAVITAGASLEVTVAGAVEVASQAAVLTTVSVGTFAGGIVVGGVGVAADIAQEALSPAQVKGLYGGDNYAFAVTGGFDYTIDPQTHKPTATGLKQFEIRDQKGGTT